MTQRSVILDELDIKKGFILQNKKKTYIPIQNSLWIQLCVVTYVPEHFLPSDPVSSVSVPVEYKQAERWISNEM